MKVFDTLATAAAFIVIASLTLVAPAHAATIDLSGLLPVVGEYLISGAAAAVAVIVGFLARQAQKWFGVEIDAKNREALHDAIRRGVNSVLESLLKRAESGARIDVDNELVATVANYVATNSPGAVKHFGLTPARLDSLIRAHFGGLLIEGGLMEADIGQAIH